MRRARHLRLAVAAVGLLALAACSSDGGASTATTAPAGTTTAEAGDAPAGTGEPLARYADHESELYADPARWLCRPDVADDVCDGDLDTTVIAADGSREVERFEADPDAPIDCFYVYPTISNDETTYSDWEPGAGEEEWVTLQQAARLGSVCRVFAPVYRQRTLTALVGNMAGNASPGGPEADPYEDVLDAFRTYMATDNGGRGVVLLGHSQGAGILKQLLAEEIDPNPDVREVLVGAYLAGTSLAVPAGEAVGGDLAEIPACTADDEVGCVVTWSTYAEGEVPDNAIFGRTDGEGRPAACTVPGAVAAGSGPLHPYLPATRGTAILGPGGDDASRTWLAEGGEAVDTPFVALPDLVTGTCRSDHGLTYLEAAMTDDAADPRIRDLGGRLTPDWGLHLLDVNLVMGDVVDQVARQRDAWTG